MIDPHLGLRIIINKNHLILSLIYPSNNLMSYFGFRIGSVGSCLCICLYACMYMPPCLYMPVTMSVYLCPMPSSMPFLYVCVSPSVYTCLVCVSSVCLPSSYATCMQPLCLCVCLVCVYACLTCHPASCLYLCPLASSFLPTFLPALPNLCSCINYLCSLMPFCLLLLPSPPLLVATL